MLNMIIIAIKTVKKKKHCLFKILIQLLMSTLAVILHFKIGVAIYISSGIFEVVPRKGPGYSHRNW